MEQQTLAIIIAAVGVLVTLLSYLRGMKQELRGEIATVNARVDESRTELKSDISELRGDLKSDISELRGELKNDIAGLRTDLKGDISELRTELKGDIAGLRTDLKGDIGMLDRRLSNIEQRTYDLSSRLPPAPAERSS